MPTNLHIVQRTLPFIRKLEVWWMFQTQEDAEGKRMQIANLRLIQGYTSIGFTGVCL